jgi:ornithine cyclodeaminase/alanine dehydrogenase-like protein (mu-crystallin family)
MNHFSLSLADIRPLVTISESIAAIESAFAALADGRAISPPVINLDIRAHHGEVHVKSAYLTGSDYYTVKIASVFTIILQ